MNKRLIRKMISSILLILFLLLITFLENKYPDFFNKIENNKNYGIERLENFYFVDRVVDGDTLIINMNGKLERLRIIGIDAPESVHLNPPANSPVECFGKESSNYLKSLIENKKVFLEYDKSQDTRDKYQRILGYVFLGEINIGEKMIMDGFAHEYTYADPYFYQKEFKLAERVAKKEKRGLWGDGVCGF